MNTSMILIPKKQKEKLVCRKRQAYLFLLCGIIVYVLVFLSLFISMIEYDGFIDIPEELSIPQDFSLNIGSGKVTNNWLLALAEDDRAIKKRKKDMIKVSCKYNIGIFVLSKEKIHFEQEDSLLNDKNSNHTSFSECAPIVFKSEGELQVKFPRSMKRVAKLTLLRDLQRNIISNEFHTNKDMNVEKGTIIVADFDMTKWPALSNVYKQVKGLAENVEKYDAICSNGAGTKQEQKYYDTYATVLLPDIFILQNDKRLFGKSDESKIIVGNDPFHLNERLMRKRYHKEINFTDKERLLEETRQRRIALFKNMGASHKNGIEPVRSCFGGMTIYKASSYLEPKCGYHINHDILTKRDKETIMRFSNIKDKRPCEHVVLHECLREQLKDFRIGISRHMVALRTGSNRRRA